jgi:hypothetical protein
MERGLDREMNKGTDREVDKGLDRRERDGGSNRVRDRRRYTVILSVLVSLFLLYFLAVLSRLS